VAAVPPVPSPSLESSLPHATAKLTAKLAVTVRTAILQLGSIIELKHNRTAALRLHTSCTHSPRDLGGATHQACSPCKAKVCQADPHCCNLQNGQWDQLCADKAAAQAECAAACAHQEPGRLQLSALSALSALSV
jgi:hypothetical protein